MKKTQIIELLKNVKATFMSFFAILMFSALSVGVFVGISWTGQALEKSTEKVFTEGNFHDFEIQFPYGLTDENLKAIQGTEGVDETETLYSSFQTATRGGEDHVAKVMSVTQKIDVPIVSEGSLPEDEGEIAVDTVWAKKQGLHIGDQLEFRHDADEDDEDGMKYLRTDTYTVTGFVISPAYISNRSTSYGFANIGTGFIDCLAYVPTESFDTDAYQGYPTVLLRSDSLRVGSTLSKDYEAAASELDDRLSSVGEAPAKERCQELRDELQENIDDGEQELDEAEEQLRDGKTQLRDAEKQLEDAKAQAAQLAALPGYAAAPEAGGDQFAEQEAQLEQKRSELEDAEDQIKDSRSQLKDLRQQLDDMRDYDWMILSRETNGGVNVISEFTVIMNHLRYSMAMLFLVIGLLVSYSSMSRLVMDQLVLTGTKKALGLRRREVTLGYLAYSGTAVFIGSVIGTAVGVFFIEPIISKQIASEFVIGKYPPVFVLDQAILIIGIEVVLIMLTAWFACSKLMKRNAVELLNGVAPPSGKVRFFEKWKVWQRLPLFTKTIVNNCFNDKRRVVGMLIGIAGCTSLVVTAISLNNNVQRSFSTQYDDVYHFDITVWYDSEDSDARDQIEKRLAENDMSGVFVYRNSYVLMQPDDKQNAVTLTVPSDTEEFRNYFTVEKTGEDGGAVYDGGTWVSVAYARHLGAKVGDEIKVSDSGGETRSLPIDGFFHHYLNDNQIITDHDTYAEVFSEECKPNAVLMDSNGQGVDAVKEALSDIDGIIEIKDDYNDTHKVFTDFSQLTFALISICLTLAVLMAVVVLFDLNMMFIEEKKRELIVLMINGFSVREAKQYVYRDTIVLTVLGIILGLVLGTVMGNLTTLSLEPVNGNLPKGIDWIACGAGVLISGALSILMCLIALRRVSRFKLTDINKL